MGSTATIIIGDGPEPLVQWVTDELGRLEQCWSRFRPDSELSELNESDGRWFPMSADLALAVDRAMSLHWMTSGLFDPTMHDRIAELGYDRTFREIDADSTRSIPRGHPSRGPVGVEIDGNYIRLPAGAKLDLGGVGKGLAADLVADGLLERGATSACVSMGGDVRAAGVTPNARGWDIPVDDPIVAGRSFGTVPLRDAAIVTSTTRIRRWQRGGPTVHHLIDPRSGYSSDTGIEAAVVRAEQAWLAEGLAKAAVIAGEELGLRLLGAADVDGWLVRSDSSVVTTTDAPAFVPRSAS
ncbi:MAG: FAD:protein FMN transferase [Ilumatobacteraceae bacterium]